MSSKKPIRKTTSASMASSGLEMNSGDDTTWIRDLPPVEESAPGDLLYETLEDFVLDQSEGEESSDDAERVEKIEQRRAGSGEGEDNEATGFSSAENQADGDDTEQQTSHLLATTQRKRKKVAYGADEVIVLYLLHHHVSLQHEARADIFNRIFSDQGIVRERGALIMQWLRFKDKYNKKFAKLSAAELAEHEAWKRKIDKAMKDAGVESQGDGKQGDDSASADDQASQLATPRPSRQPRETRARYTADHEIVLHILYGRKNLDTGTLTEIFNHVFRAEGIVRNRAALGKHWARFKARIQKRFANLSRQQLAEHEWWKQKVDEAIEELSR